MVTTILVTRYITLTGTVQICRARRGVHIWWWC